MKIKAATVSPATLNTPEIKEVQTRCRRDSQLGDLRARLLGFHPEKTCLQVHLEMSRVLLTAFEPYDPWPTNASWLALIELTRKLPTDVEITTRLYPVELQAMKEKLAADLRAKYDYAFHIGQAPRSSCLQLEEVALNVASVGHKIENVEAARPVCDNGPAAYQSRLPIREYAKTLRDAGIPARVSFHAGTYLCNAILYWSCRLADDLDLATKSTFVHIPLDTSQVLELDEDTPFMPSSMVAHGLRTLVCLAINELPQSLA